MEKLTDNQKLDLGHKHWRWGMTLMLVTCFLAVGALVVGGMAGFGFWTITLIIGAISCFILSQVYLGLSMRLGYH